MTVVSCSCQEFLANIHFSNKTHMPLQCQQTNTTSTVPYSYSLVFGTGRNPLSVIRKERNEIYAGLVAKMTQSTLQGKRKTRHTSCFITRRINGKRSSFTTLDAPCRLPSELTFQYLTVWSPLPLTNPLPSGVNATRPTYGVDSACHTSFICPCHLATSLCVLESHIQIEPSRSPATTYRSSGLNVTERK